MSAYLLRRVFYVVPILVGVNLLTFLLFFSVNTPEGMARLHLGDKRVDAQAIEQWMEERGYDRPLFVNGEASGLAAVTDTIFFQKSVRLFAFEFGRSDSGRDISHDIRQRMWPSLALAVPTFVVGLAVSISFALILVLFHRTRLDTWGVLFCVMLMSVSTMFYIIGGQYLFGKLLHWAPISGFGEGVDSLRFLYLPVAVGVFSALGAESRRYRSYFLEEIGKDYVRTARAKGASELQLMFRHVLPNALIPVLTGVVVVIPLLFIGSLVMESFFAIPGLGSYTLDAIQAQDFAIVRAMVFLGSVLYIVGLLMTDIAYTLVDPRVRLR